MLGLMQQHPLLISSLLTFAARHHGNGEIVSPHRDATPLGAPPGVRHRRGASSVIAGDRLYVFGGYDGIDDRSADLWIRRLPSS